MSLTQIDAFAERIRDKAESYQSDLEYEDHDELVEELEALREVAARISALCNGDELVERAERLCEEMGDVD